MPTNKSFFNRMPIPSDKRLLAEVESALKGFAAGIIGVVEKHALRYHKGAAIVVGVYAEGMPKCYGKFQLTTWKRMHTGALIDSVLGLMDIVRATADKGNREVRVSVDIIDRKEAKKNGQQGEATPDQK